MKSKPKFLLRLKERETNKKKIKFDISPRHPTMFDAIEWAIAITKKELENYKKVDNKLNLTKNGK